MSVDSEVSVSPTMIPALLKRVVVPRRLALIIRGEATAAYNREENVWYLVDDVGAAVLRWLRAERPRAELADYLMTQFVVPVEEVERRLDEALAWCILRRLLYLDQAPVEPVDAVPDNALAAVYWISTQACNLRCTYCYQDATVARSDELSTTEALAMVDQVAASGARTLVITGGEPFSRRDLRTVAEHSRSIGLRTNVITNGHYITERTLPWVSATFDVVTISLDHMRPEHHDEHRGAGSWRRAVAAIRLLVGAGVAVDVNSVLSRAGLADLDGLLDIRGLGVGAHRVVPQFPMGRGNDTAVDALTESELLALDDALRDVARRRTPAARAHREGGYSAKGSHRSHCGAGLSEVSIDPQGWVYPCKLLQYPQNRGWNVRDRPLAEIYAESPVLNASRSNTTAHLDPCRSCIVRYHCGGGCRGIHASFTGADTKSSPLFCSFIRRSFESQLWEQLDVPVTGRRNDYRVARRPLPLVMVNGREPPR